MKRPPESTGVGLSEKNGGVHYEQTNNTCPVVSVTSAHAAVVTTNLQTPFTDSVVVGNATRSEAVKLSGQLFVLTQVTPPNPIAPITVTSVAVASGVGQTAGVTYLAAGTSRAQGTFTMPGTFSAPVD